MASAIVGALRVILSADTAEFETAMQRVSGSAKAWSNDLGVIGRQATALGQNLTRTVTLPLLALGAGAAKVAIDFESSFAGVRKTVDATEPELAAMAQAFRDLSKDIPVNVNELNRLGEAAGALGIPKAEIVDFARVMAQLGVTTNLTSEQAASSIAKIQNIFGAAGKDTERFASTLVALGNEGASTESEILELGNRIASAGRAAGLTQGQVLGFASAIANVGIQAEAGGSAFSKVLNDMGQAVSKQGNELQKFANVAGMTGAQFTKLFREDAASAAQAFIEGLGKMHKSGKDLNIVIDDLGFSEIRQSNLLRSLALSGDNVAKSLDIQKRAWSDNSALSKEAGERFKTVESQLTLLWNRLKDVGITLGNALLPMISATARVVGELVPYLEKAVNLFGRLPVPLQAAVVGVAALAAAAGPLLMVFGSMATGASALIGAFTTKGLAMRALTAIYPAVVTGIKAVGGAIAAASTSFVAIGALATGLVLALVEVGKAVVNLYNHWKAGKSMWDFFTAKDDDNFVRRGLRWAGILEDVKKRTTDIALANDQAAQSTEEFVGPLQQAGSAAHKTEEELKAAEEAAKKFAASLKSLGGAEAMSGAQEVIRQLQALGGPMNVLPSQLGSMAERMREAAQAAMLMGKVDLAGQYTKLAETLSPMVQFQQRWNVTIGEYVPIGDAAAETTAMLWEQFYRLTGQLQTVAPVLENKIKLPWVSFAQTVYENSPKMQKSFDGVRDAVASLGQTIINALQGGGNVLQAVGATIGRGLAADFVDNFGHHVTNLLGNTFGGLVNSFLPGIGAMLGPALGAIGNGLKRVFGIGINEEVRKANAEIDKLRQGLLQTHGPLDVLEQKANAVGLSFAAAWQHQGRQGLEEFNRLIEEFNRRWEELEAQRAELEQQSADTRGELDSLIGKAREMGYEFNQQGEFIRVNFEAVRRTAQDFGIDINSLGPALRQQAMDQEALKIINAFELLAKAGGDVGGILAGMKDEIGKLVSDSIKFGTTIPANMKPWIEELIRTGQLVDENGHAITDLTTIKFGEPVATEFEKIADKLQEVVDKLAAILEQIAAIPTQRDFTVRANYVDPGPPEGFGDPTRSNEPGFATGTLGRLGEWFGRFPSEGFVTALHGTEAVVTPQQAPMFAADVLGSMTPPSLQQESGLGGIGEMFNRLEHTLVTTIPALAESAARHGAQTAGRRR